jgi:hypothetical protein
VIGLDPLRHGSLGVPETLAALEKCVEHEVPDEMVVEILLDCSISRNFNQRKLTRIVGCS